MLAMPVDQRLFFDATQRPGGRDARIQQASSVTQIEELDAGMAHLVESQAGLALESIL
jgi:hypothetical protein